MEGASSDLRTGLPKQMIEIHEAMRLLIVLEALPELVTQIYQRQPLLQQLIGNEWVQLAVKIQWKMKFIVFTLIMALSVGLMSGNL